MRSCKVKKSWEKVFNRKTNNYFVSLELSNFQGINTTIQFPENGIIAFCGLNGVGKTSILTCIKSLSGMELNELEKIKIGSTNFKATFKSNDENLLVNNDSLNLRSMGKNTDSFIFIDFETSNKMLDFLINQQNVGDLVESNEFYEYKEEQIKELNTIIGKNYKKIDITEIEVEDNYIIPFFKVRETDLEYNTLTMGKGEYYLFYVFWSLDNAKKNSTFIIDEPENGISISSQQNLMDYIATKLETSTINIILTTHSPYILHRLRNDNIKILNKIGKETNVLEPKEPDAIENLLNIDKFWDGVLIVEDKVAEEFLLLILEHFAPYILNDYRIVICPEGKDGIGNIIKSISKIQTFPYKVIGIFDGDVTTDEKLNSITGTCCLPGIDPLEEEIRSYLENKDNRLLFSQKLKCDVDKFSLIHSKHIGEDYHDWFINLFKELHTDGKTLINAYFELTLKDKENDINTFIEKLKGLIES